MIASSLVIYLITSACLVDTGKAHWKLGGFSEFFTLLLIVIDFLWSFSISISIPNIGVCDFVSVLLGVIILIRSICFDFGPIFYFYQAIGRSGCVCSCCLWQESENHKCRIRMLHVLQLPQSNVLVMLHSEYLCACLLIIIFSMISPIYQWKIKWMFKGIVFVCVGFLESLLIHGNIEAMHG